MNLKTDNREEKIIILIAIIAFAVILLKVIM
jgi:hypothetical protein